MPHLDSYLAEVRQTVATSYDIDRAEFDGREVLVARRSDFRWRWFATRLHTTVTVATFDEAVDPWKLDEYLEAGGRAARTAVRGVRGMQTGAAVVGVAVLPTLSDAARAWASQPHGHKFASIAYPVAVGLSPPEVVELRRMRMGVVYRHFLRGIVADVITAPLSRT
jgi:hypothetical protein